MNDPYEIDVAIIGAGVVGLAVGWEVVRRGSARAGRVFVLERNATVGQETSSRNSGVLHSGIYYETGSLKARLCVEGAERLRALCVDADLNHRLDGKLIVARSQDEEPLLEHLYRLGTANGARDLRIVGRSELARLEPRVCGRAALLSPHTGVVDPWELVQHLKTRYLAGGGELLCRAAVTGIVPQAKGGYRVRVQGPHEGPQGNGAEEVVSRVVVNAAGLQADRLAEAVGIDVRAAGYVQHYCKGRYCRVKKSALQGVERLIYPVPRHLSGGLGVHLTRDPGGGVRLGPDAAYVERVDPPDYTVDEACVDQFWRAARTFFPCLQQTDLNPDMAGIRPRIYTPGQATADFVVRHEQDRGLIGFFDLIGIESPGLTACLALGRQVAAQIHRVLQ